jgi:hypothetical protein
MRGAWQKILKAAPIKARKRDRKYAKPALQSSVPEVSPWSFCAADVADVIVSDAPGPDPTPDPKSSAIDIPDLVSQPPPD